jgi:hypothetical protein
MISLLYSYVNRKSPQSTTFAQSVKGFKPKATLYPPAIMVRRDPSRIADGPNLAPGR